MSSTCNAYDGSHHADTSLPGQPSRTPAAWDSSSTIVLVEEAFHHHDSRTPQEDETSAFSASQWIKPVVSASHGTRRRRQSDQDSLQRLLSQQVKNKTKHTCRPHILSTSVGGELWSLLPNSETATLLVNNYFDRIHWFMLLFHQRQFRSSFEALYASVREQAPSSVYTSQVGYIAVLLSVCAISLQYTTMIQREALGRYGTDPDKLKHSILTTLRLRLLDILSLGSLEAVQTCVLLGSYYLYQGQPELAWPLCGCGLRIAQALNLHRKAPFLGGDQRDDSQHMIAARQRCWWAVYEIETFCSMLYGFPLSISDSDCDVEELDPHDTCSAASAHGDDPTQPNLLFFKCAMSKLSKIVKRAVTDLYGTHRNLDRHNKPITNYSTRLQSLIAKVADLEETLSQWHQALPSRLRPVPLDRPSTEQRLTAGGKQGTSNESFMQQLFHLQVLTLKLAYENARILVHRPLLSYKAVVLDDVAPGSSNSRDDPFQRSIQRCRDAALEISRIGTTAVFRQVLDTYAATFVSLHLFTAGVTLCILTSLDPLSYESHESKMGIRRLMEMQTTLKPKSIAASQGFDILQRLLSLVMAKEIRCLFDMQSPRTGESPVITDVAESGNQHSKNALGSPQGGPPTAFRSSAAPLFCPTNIGRASDSIEVEGTALSLEDSGVGFGFCENLSMAEALLDLEQAISYPISNAADEEHPPATSDDYASQCPVIGQDQAWIWGWNCNLEGLDVP